MKKYLFIAMLWLTGALIVSAQESNEDPDVKYAADLLKPGTVAPEFVVDFKDTTQNTPLSSFRGRYVVLDFWASWCPDCRKDIPKVKKLHDAYSLNNVAFIGVSFDTDRDAWVNCIRKNKMNWLHYSELKKWKKESKIDRDYHINWIPTYYIIDPDGKVLLGTVVLDKVENELRRLSEEGLITQMPIDTDKPSGMPSLPGFPGGETARQTFMANNLKYPQIARKYKAGGKVKMMFEVGEDGKLGNFEAKNCVITSYSKTAFDKLTTAKQEELKKAISLAFAKEAYNVMKKMPAWTPGVLNGKPVKTKMTQTITYYLK
ncbi:MAG: thioredoxin-like domain-containing protein [Prevotella sp.]|jgi:thiol-disulfide isomerase/thioredoxin